MSALVVKPELLPRVSVCIPTVDRPRLFREAIASVAMQTLSDFEIVVGDNSGRSECHRQIDAILAEFSGLRFKLVRHDRHIDVADNFNSMIDAAEGDFWVCLPDDDRFRPNFLERSVGALDRHPECAFTFADHWIVDADGTVDALESTATSVRFGRTRLREGIYLHGRLFELVLGQSLCLQTALFRRPTIEELRFVPGILALDQSLFLRLSAGIQAFNGYYIDEKIMDYRIHPGQVSSTTHRSDFLRAVISAFESVDVTSVPVRHARDFRERLGRNYLALAMLEAEQGANVSARRHALRGLRFSPSLSSAARALLAIVAPRTIPPLRRVLERRRVSSVPAK